MADNEYGLTNFQLRSLEARFGSRMMHCPHCGMTNFLMSHHPKGTICCEVCDEDGLVSLLGVESYELHQRLPAVQA
jgi:hypothetical protein